MIDDDVFAFVHVLKGVWKKKTNTKGPKNTTRTWRVGDIFEGKLFILMQHQNVNCEKFKMQCDTKEGSSVNGVWMLQRFMN